MAIATTLVSNPQVLWLSKPEYRDESPLYAFRSKIEPKSTCIPLKIDGWDRKNDLQHQVECFVNIRSGLYNSNKISYPHQKNQLSKQHHIQRKHYWIGNQAVASMETRKKMMFLDLAIQNTGGFSSDGNSFGKWTIVSIVAKCYGKTIVSGHFKTIAF
jgi:hypothetical protein